MTIRLTICEPAANLVDVGINQELADNLAAKLRSGVTHPGDGKRQKPWGVVLPFFRTAGKTKEETELADTFSQSLAEAIVNEIEADYEITPRAEAARLKDVARNADSKDARTVMVHCRCDTQRTDPLAVLTVGAGSEVVIDGKQLIRYLSQREIKCPHKGKAKQ